MAAKLTKEELMEKIKDIDNEELKKKLSELTEEDLKNVVGGTINPDGEDIGVDIQCPYCKKYNTMLSGVGYYVYCFDCDICFHLSREEMQNLFG